MKKLSLLLMLFVSISAFSQETELYSVQDSANAQCNLHQSSPAPMHFHHKYFGVGQTLHFTVKNRSIYLIESTEYERLVELLEFQHKQNEQLKLRLLQLQKAKLD